MKIRKRILPLLLVIILVFGMIPQHTRADDASWTQGKITVRVGIWNPNYGRDSAQYDYYSMASWVQMYDYKGLSATLVNSNDEAVATQAGSNTFTFENLSEGDYKLKLSFTNSEHEALLVFLKGLKNGPAIYSQDQIVSSKETNINISKEKGNRELFAVFEYKAYGLAAETSVGTFSNGEQTKQYFEGWNRSVVRDEQVYNQHNGIYRGDHAELYYNGTFTLEEPTLSASEKEAGYKFKGWRIKNDSSGKIYSALEAIKYKIYEDTTFVAEWDYPTHKVMFKTNPAQGTINGKAADSYIVDFDNQKLGEAITIPKVDSTDGHEFIGWYLDPTENVLSDDELTNTIVDRDLTFYAKYRELPKDVQVNFVANEGGTTEQESLTIKEGSKVGIKPQAKANPGYVFTGWKCSEGGLFDSEEIEKYEVPIGKSSVTFTAQFTEDSKEDPEPVPTNEYTVTFKAGDNGKTTQAAVKVKAGSKVGVNPAATPNSGYELLEWKCSEGGSFSAAGVADYVVRGNVTFTAQFTQKKGGSTDPIDNLLKTSPIGSNIKVLDNALKKLKNDGDIKGATFGKLKLRGWSKGKKAVLLRWTKTTGATKYILYGNQCGKKYRYKKVKTFNAKTFKYIPKKIMKSKIKKGKYHKFMMTAVDKSGKVIAVSKTVHVTTAGGKKGNDKSVKRVSPKNGKVTLKVKKSRKLKVKEVRGKLKVARHRVVSWESSNSKIATVKKGKVTAKKKGTCTIWAYAQNGVYTTFKVTVK